MNYFKTINKFHEDRKVFAPAVRDLRSATNIGLRDATIMVAAYEALTGKRFHRPNSAENLDGFTPLKEVWVVYVDDGFHEDGVLMSVHLTKAGAEQHILRMKSDDADAGREGFSYYIKVGGLEL